MSCFLLSSIFFTYVIFNKCSGRNIRKKILDETYTLIYQVKLRSTFIQHIFPHKISWWYYPINIWPSKNIYHYQKILPYYIWTWWGSDAFVVEVAGVFPCCLFSTFKLSWLFYLQCIWCWWLWNNLLRNIFK